MTIFADDLMEQRNELLAAIRKYRLAVIACEQCSAMLLSDGLDPEPARLMDAMENARLNLWKTEYDISKLQ